jgi:hypothetical protein
MSLRAMVCVSVSCILNRQRDNQTAFGSPLPLPGKHSPLGHRSEIIREVSQPFMWRPIRIDRLAARHFSYTAFHLFGALREIRANEWYSKA